MYFINLHDKTTNKNWKEEFDSYYFFRKRVTKLKYSKKLMVLSHSNLDQEAKNVKEIKSSFKCLY